MPLAVIVTAIKYYALAVIVTAIIYYTAFNRSLFYVIVYMRGFQNNTSFTEYSDRDNLAAIWAGTNNQQIYSHEDLWMGINVANNQQTYNRDDLISMNTIYNNIIARTNHSNTILDNFLIIEGNHINAIQGDLDNLTNVGEDYLAANYNDPIDSLAATYDDPIDSLAATYDDPINIERLTTIYNDSINI
ncbi:6795_t:CDS:2 [Dentiscutata erythropus]|uniref:6795_t:CDS:1 n=1 Tax=Dentiscutata erythropus TaxID=1348616 RepID=A0A9N9HPZ7_9GLOM|nr:6795_t:CDS:2 [Dentiscutata erythropus]